MKKYEIVAVLYELELDKDGDEVDRKVLTQGVISANDDKQRIQTEFDFLVHTL